MSELSEIAEGSLTALLNSAPGKALLGPGCKTLGETGDNLLKTALLCTGIGPILQFGAIQYDTVQCKLKKYRARILNSLDEVPEPERLKAVPDNIAAPILKNLWECNDEILTKCYQSLLSMAISKTNCYKCHPAFVKIIEQLVPDQILMCEFIRKHNEITYIRAAEPITEGGVDISYTKNTKYINNCNLFNSNTELQHKDMFLENLWHLENLGIVEHEVNGLGKDKGAEYKLILTSFGDRFVDACTT